MRITIALLLAFFFLSASCVIVAKPAFSSTDAAEDTWVAKAPMQAARGNLGVAVVNGKIYAIGGSAENGVVGTNEEYNLATDTWTYKKPMPTLSAGFATAVYQNKIYCIDEGMNEVYDPATDTWETKTPMPTPRTGLQANVVGGEIYLIGGYVPAVYTTPNFTATPVNEAYDPATDSWSTKAPIPVAVESYVSAVVENRIYVFGGVSNIEVGTLNQIYNAETDSWSQGAVSPYSIYFGFAAATEDVNAPVRIYILHQDLSSPPFSDAPFDGYTVLRVYDPEKGRWASAATPPTNRGGYGFAILNDTLYAVGGGTTTFDLLWRSHTTLFATNEQYTPFGYGTPDPSYDGVAPVIGVVSPANKTYCTSGAGLNITDVALNFTVDEPVFSVRYVLDGGVPVEISGNTTIAGLAVGAHNVSVFGFDASGNMGTSETVCFTVAEPEPFPATMVIAPVASVAVVGVVLAVYFKRRKR